MKVSAKDAIKQFNVELLHQLPLENDIFFAMARRAGLFPMDTGDSIAAEPTRAKKVAFLLQHVVEPGAEEYLPKLLIVMKESKVANVIRLAEDIQAVTGIGKYNSYVHKYFAGNQLSNQYYIIYEVPTSYNTYTNF